MRSDLGAELSRADVEHAPFYDLLPLRGVALGTVQQTIGAEVADSATAHLLDADPGSARCWSHAASRATPMARRSCTRSTAIPADRTTLEIEFSLNVGVLEHV